MYGRRVSLCAQLKQLPPSASNVNDGIGWVSDDAILLSLSLSVVLQRNMQSLSTPLLFQSMHLNCVPKVEAAISFFQLSRIFIPSLDPEHVEELHAPPPPSRSSRNSTSRAADATGAKVDSVLQHPHVQHKSTMSLHSLDVLEWLELVEQQLEAACSFETADIPPLILLRERHLENGPLRRSRWSAKDQWQIRLKSEFQSRTRANVNFSDIAYIEAIAKSNKLDLNNETIAEKESFDPLQLLQQLLSKDDKDAYQARAREDKVRWLPPISNSIVCDAPEQELECARAEAALAAARDKKETPAKIASLAEEFFRLQRQVEVFRRAQEQLEWRKQVQAASDGRAKKAAEVERLRSLRVLNTQNSLRQSWQQFIGNALPAHSVALFALYR